MNFNQNNAWINEIIEYNYTNNDVNSILEFPLIFRNNSSSAAHMNFDFQKLSQTEDNLADLVSKFSSGSQNQSL